MISTWRQSSAWRFALSPATPLLVVVRGEGKDKFTREESIRSEREPLFRVIEGHPRARFIMQR